MIVLHLPFPPSVNSANNYGRKGYYPSDKKKSFFWDANALYLTQKRSLSGHRIEGPFTYHIVLNRSQRRRNADGDNHTKYVLDFAQTVGLIENDKLAEGGSWSWGECEHGAMLSIHPVNVASASIETKDDAEAA
jgi:Holliday junction resolvase RusA-like endonuclease